MLFLIQNKNYVAEITLSHFPSHLCQGEKLKCEISLQIPVLADKHCALEKFKQQRVHSQPVFDVLSTFKPR